MNDREDRLRRATMVFSPQIWNFGLPLRRLPLPPQRAPAHAFAPDCVFMLFEPCRLHFFDLPAEHGIELARPEAGYDPETEPYFDKFGGHLAFAAYIAIDKIAERALDVRKLLPSGRVHEAAEALGRAMRVEDQRNALQAWETEISCSRTFGRDRSMAERTSSRRRR